MIRDQYDFPEENSIFFTTTINKISIFLKREHSNTPGGNIFPVSSNEFIAKLYQSNFNEEINLEQKILINIMIESLYNPKMCLRYTDILITAVVIL